MQHAVLSTDSPTPPQLPSYLAPPLPLSSVYNKQHVQASKISPVTAVLQQMRKAWKYFLLDKGLYEDDSHDYIFLSSYLPVQTVIQNGPTCGMVALAMASQLTGKDYVSAEEILSEAVKRGFSKQGEMFTASALQELAAHFLSCKAECVHLQRCETTGSLDGRHLADQLMRRHLVLIPYDASNNHGPCQKKGHKAHWALLTGFFAAVKASAPLKELCSELRAELNIPFLYYWPEEPDQVLHDLVVSQGDFFVFGHHGKSKHAGCWSLKDLLLSNDNLVETAPYRVSEEYVLPPSGLEAGLKSQMVVVHMTSSIHSTS